MRKWIQKWEPKDVIGLILIIGAIYLLARGINHQVGWALIAIVVGYYGIDLTPWIKLGRNQKNKTETP